MSERKSHPAIKYALAFLFSALALYLALRKQRFSVLADELSDANILIILAGTGVMFLSHFVRAWRYKMFMRPMKKDARVTSAFRALIAGYAMNNVIPRSGDIVRPLLFSKREEIPITSAVAVLLIERLSDLMGLAAVLIVSLLLFKDQINLAIPGIEAITIPLLIGLVLVFLFGLLILLSEKATVRVITVLTSKLPASWREHIRQATFSLEEGLRGVRTGAAFPLIVGTLGIWLLYAASMYVSLYAFQSPELQHVGFAGCILLQTLSGLAFTVPTPGGTGTYHFFVSQALANIFGVPPEVGVAYATLTHASNYLMTTVVGIAFMVIDGVSIGDVKKDSPSKLAVVQARRAVLRPSSVQKAAIRH
jgi:glycosyltransferase 2 family protein